MKRVLLITSVASMIDQFNRRNIKILQELGCHVEVACNFKKGNTCSKEKAVKLLTELKEQEVECFQIDFDRDITNAKAVKNAYIQLQNVFLRHYDLVHCQSPIGGVLGRVLAWRTGVPVIYTAHGLHFFRGSGLKSWILYYPAEQLMARFTDLLITINQEDYLRAKKKKLGKKVVYLPGVGVDTSRFCPPTKEEHWKCRDKLLIHEEEILILSVGELSRGKNHRTALRAIAGCAYKKIRYCICGIGKLREELEAECEMLGIGKQVIFAGFQEDLRPYYQAADIFLFPSLREGLSVALMEAMASGLPIVCSDIRGNRELVDVQGGRRVEPLAAELYRDALLELIGQKKLREKMAQHNREKIEGFRCELVDDKMFKIYREFQEK